MRRVLKTKAFQGHVKKVGLTDEALCKADLGGGVVKKRVALPGRGKSGGARTLLATNRASRWIFVFGFKKNDRANVSPAELEALRMLARDLLALGDAQLQQAIASGELKEICHEQTG